MYSAKIIADSYAGIRLTSFEVTYPSNLHAEMVSNRDLSVTAFGGNTQRPLTTTRAIITATHLGFSAFFNRYLGVHTGTAGVIQALTDLMRQQLRTQEPATLGEGDWHLPYIDFPTLEDAALVAIDDAVSMCAVEHGLRVTMICRMLSVARCNGVALASPPYPVQRGYHARRMQFYANEIDAYSKLLSRLSLFGDAFEHQATPDTLDPRGSFEHPEYHGNLLGWQQHRKMFIEAPLVIEPVTCVVKEQQYHG